MTQHVRVTHADSFRLRKPAVAATREEGSFSIQHLVMLNRAQVAMQNLLFSWQ